MPTPSSDALPPWRANLLAIPPERRSRYQRDLVRGAQLTDLIKEELKTPITLSLTDSRSLKILAFCAEAAVLGPFELTALLLMDQASIIKFNDILVPFEYVVMDMWRPSALAGNKHGPFVSVPPLTAVLYIVQLSFGLTMTKQQDDFPFLAAILRASVQGLDAAQWTGVDEQLAAVGSTLDAATLRQVTWMLYYMMSVSDPDVCNLGTIKLAVSQAMLPAASRDCVPLWEAFVLSRCFICLVRPLMNTKLSEGPYNIRVGTSDEESLVSELSAACKACTTMLQQALAAAEAERDQGLIAFAAGTLAYMIAFVGMEPTPDSYVKGLVAKTDAALAAARSWLPKTHREVLGTKFISDQLKNISGSGLIKSSVYINTAKGDSCVPGRQSVVFDIDKATVAPVMKSYACAVCGLVSQECKTCAGCHVRHYCSVKCQRAHWKTHNKECKELKARREAEGVAGQQ